jgi:hypothetical protein
MMKKIEESLSNPEFGKIGCTEKLIYCKAGIIVNSARKNFLRLETHK